MMMPGGQQASGPDQAKWRSRGYLPHFESAGTAQAVTFRLADSLPRPVLAQIESAVADLGAKTDSERRRRIEDWLDAAGGSCWLRDPRIAGLVEDAILFLDRRKYHLHAWVVMPNHVHVLLTPIGPMTLAVIIHSLKSYTAKEANRLLCRTGTFWQREYFDRAIRDSDHFRDAVAYIEANPLKAGLCARVGDWRFSSARLGRNR